MSRSLVSILMGSQSDMAVMQACLDTLKKFDVQYSVRILSAHRTPEEVVQHVSNEVASGTKVFICAAGFAAHLAGAVAAQTIVPVIGVPLAASDLQGMDALLSTVQMPKGIPVATVAIGKTGAINAACLAVQILGIMTPELQQKLLDDRRSNAKKILETVVE